MPEGRAIGGWVEEGKGDGMKTPAIVSIIKIKKKNPTKIKV